MCFIECPECWCTIHELGEPWAVTIDFIEESYLYSTATELRGVDAGHEFFYIFGNAFKTKLVESGEDRAF